LYVYGLANSIREGYEIAKKVLRSGKGKNNNWLIKLYCILILFVIGLETLNKWSEAAQKLNK